MADEFEMLRGERRSFFCPNTLWAELKTRTGDKISISTYIKQAITEKLIRDEPQSEMHIKELLI